MDEIFLAGKLKLIFLSQTNFVGNFFFWKLELKAISNFDIYIWVERIDFFFSVFEVIIYVKLQIIVIININPIIYLLTQWHRLLYGGVNVHDLFITYDVMLPTLFSRIKKKTRISRFSEIINEIHEKTSRTDNLASLYVFQFFFFSLTYLLYILREWELCQIHFIFLTHFRNGRNRVLIFFTSCANLSRKVCLWSMWWWWYDSQLYLVYSARPHMYILKCNIKIRNLSGVQRIRNQNQSSREAHAHNKSNKTR